MDENALVTLSNGIVLRMKPMPPLLLNAIVANLPPPPVPMIFIEEDNRYEENPNHPEYVKALEEHTHTVGMKTIEAILAIGTEIVSIPNGMMRPEDDGWLKRAERAGFKLNLEDPEERYVAWLQLYAIEKQHDLDEVNSIPMILAGVREDEVAKAIADFRSAQGRGADTELPDEVGSENGNHVPDVPSGTRTRNRRT